MIKNRQQKFLLNRQISVLVFDYKIFIYCLAVIVYGNFCTMHCYLLKSAICLHNVIKAWENQRITANCKQNHLYKLIPNSLGIGTGLASSYLVMEG